MRIPLYHWIPYIDENLGDWLSIPILQGLGCEPVSVTPDSACLFAIGSILHPDHYAASNASRIVVWGSGLGIGLGHNPPVTKPLDFHAVRGPVTIRAFGLPESTPTGDPALLLPQLVKLPTVQCAELLYINHIGTKPCNDAPGFVSVSAHVGKDDGLNLVAKIAGARFVASESLHGCIIAAAYGVPWAPCSLSTEPQWTTIGSYSKWNDWLEYLGLPHLDYFPKTTDAAQSWWKTIGIHGKIKSLKPLLDAFENIKRVLQY